MDSTPSSFLLLLLSSFSVVLSESLVAYETPNTFTIHNASEFVEFSENVNNGTCYTGMTVFLDSDIDFSGRAINAIGRDWSNHFNGTFNGKGHMLSNLHISSTSLKYLGLFSNLNGAVIKNLVMDSSCSVTSLYSEDYTWVHVGGIVGCFGTKHRDSLIENIVTMATTSFTGRSESYFLIGGIAGHTEPRFHNFTIRNCVNYGTVIYSGKANNTLVGGIIGYSDYYFRETVQNCLNYGTLIHNGTTLEVLMIGGIIGSANSGNNFIENCVNAGKIETNKESELIGNIVGKINETSSEITHCFWTSDTGISSLGGFVDAKITNSSVIELNAATAGFLNDHASKNPILNRWFSNPNNSTITFTLNNKTTLATASQLILTPEPLGDESNSFAGWYTDPYCTHPLAASEITGDATLYGLYGAVVTITLGFDGGDPQEGTTGTKAALSNSPYGELPEPAKAGHTFLGWFSEESCRERITSNSTVQSGGNATIYACWIANNYTVKFDLGDGKVTERIIEFNASVSYPEDVERDGYAFDKWDVVVEFMPAENITITALWTKRALTSKYVEIVLGRSEMSENEIKVYIERFVDGSDYTIKKFESDGKNGETVVTIEFIDKTDAEKFVREVEKSLDSDVFIRRIEMVDYVDSFVPMFCPKMLFGILLF